MYVLLSPAKKLHEPPAAAAIPFTQPQLMADTEMLMRSTRTLSSKKLQALMHISENLGELNHQRYQDWQTPFDENNARQAVLSFAGDVYIGFQAENLSNEDLDWAQDHVGILSGLYGLLRPLDLMQPYRLEMGTKLKTRRGPTLYAFWGERIAKTINEMAGDQVVLNLASNEYFKSVKTKALDGRVVTPVFRDVKDGKAKTISFFAKRARGEMTRWIVQNRVTEVESLKDCEVMGYTFHAATSTADKWVFQRPSPT